MNSEIEDVKADKLSPDVFEIASKALGKDPD